MLGLVTGVDDDVFVVFCGELEVLVEEVSLFGVVVFCGPILWCWVEVV